LNLLKPHILPRSKLQRLAGLAFGDGHGSALELLTVMGLIGLASLASPGAPPVEHHFTVSTLANHPGENAAACLLFGAASNRVAIYCLEIDRNDGGRDEEFGAGGRGNRDVVDDRFLDAAS